MDKNTLIGFLLMGAVIFGFMYFNTPSQEELEAQRQAQQEQIEQAAIDNAATKETPIDSLSANEIKELSTFVKAYGIADAENADVYTYKNESVNLVCDSVLSGTVTVEDSIIDVNTIINADVATLATPIANQAVKNLKDASSTLSKYGQFTGCLASATDTATIRLQNDVLALDFATKGGVISRVELLQHKDGRTGKNVVLFDNASNNNYYFTLPGTTRRLETRDFVFSPEISEDSTSVLMKLNLGNGASWGMRYSLKPGSYVVAMDIVQEKASEVIESNANSFTFHWHQKMGRTEKGRTFEERNSGIYYKYVGEDEDPENLNENEDDSEELKQQVKWIAFKNQFFSSIIIPRKAFNSANIESTVIANDDYLKNLTISDATIGYSTQNDNVASFDFFFGPNLYPMLSDLDEQLSPEEDLQLTEVIPLGWGIFGWINKFIIIPVFTFLGGFLSNYGLIILLLTIFIKIIIFPFTYKSYMSQAKMRVLAPEIKEINDKYPNKEDAMVRQQKTMELYSRAGASPFSGCLPMLLQMPVLIAMFSFFPSCIELRGQSFLWAKDLAAPDAIIPLGFDMPLLGTHLSLFCLLMTATNIIYTRINMQNQPGGSSMPGMKWMMYLMPVMFLVFFNEYAAGLSYYYFLSLLITIIQTYVFRRVIDEKKVRAQLLENTKKPRKKSGFMARLEEAQRRQQAMLREQQKQKGKRK